MRPGNLCSAQAVARLAGRLAALAIMGVGWLVAALPVQAGQALNGHVPSVTKHLQPTGRLDNGALMHISIGLPLRNREKLTNLLAELYDPAHPNFRHFLSQQEFAANYGPSEEDYQKVIAFANSHGLSVKKTHANRTLLDVRGSVANIEKAFHLNLRVYQHPKEARTFFAPDAEPSPDLDTPLLAISGLDNYRLPRPQLRRSSQLARTLARPLGGGGSGGGGTPAVLMGYDFRDAYAPGITLDGTGQYVGLFELIGYDAEDITDYEDEAGLPYALLQNVLVDGFDGDDGSAAFANNQNIADYSVECTADIEMAASMAPGLAGIIVYEGPTPLYEAPLETNFVQYDTTTAQVNDVLNQMAVDNLAKQLSSSYEMDINTSTIQIFQQFAAQGQSFFQGSGDSGGYPSTVDEPADDPYLTVVGGTTLTIKSSGAWTSETVWLTPASSDPLLGDIPAAASGGGVSLTYPIPAWQQGISMSANQGSTTMRNLPDVALVANNIDIVWGNNYIGESFDLTEAGTSLATPLWAAFMALVNQQGAALGKPPVGFANPALYAIAKSTNYKSCFHDITTGNSYSAANPAKYAATTGYDLCTGWGTIIGSNLIPALLSPPTEPLVITSPLGFTSSGPGGGPFTVTSQTYTLTNIGSAPLQWSLVNTSLWLTVSATSGTLNPHGAAATVTVNINTTATNFLIGNFSGNVTFDNLSAGTTQNRQFDLYVGNGGFEAGDFTYWTLAGDTNLTFALSGDDADVGGTNALQDASDTQFVHSGLYGAYLGEFDNDGQSPTNGALSQAVVTTPGQRYLVSFWLTSVASQGQTTPNYFAAKWNGSTLYAQTNLNAFGWTNLQFTVPATAKSTTLEFDFNNVPGAFGLDDVSVANLPAPAWQSAKVGGGAITLTWSSVANLSYQLQATGSLNSPNWTNVVPVVTASNGTASVSAPLGTASKQFYRVLLLPPP